MSRGRGDAGPADPLADLDAMRLEIAGGAVAVSDAILAAGAERLDALFGEGYAAAHPELLGRYLETTAAIFETDVATALDPGDDPGGAVFGAGPFAEDPADRGRRRR